MAEIEVRTATAPDVEHLSAMLTRAFDDDPLTVYLLGSADRRRALHARRFFAWELRRLLGQEQIHVAGEHLGAALWALPGRWRESPGEGISLVLRVLPAVLMRGRRLARSLTAIERIHPRRPHMYLAVLGTEPSQQGRGVGSAAIAPGLALADAEGLPCYLESSKQRNIAFYARFGFTVMRELAMPGGGPSVWPMWREPRAVR